MPFSGPIRTQWRPDGVTMIVLSSVGYTDPRGRVWPLPGGTIIDGASIPGLFQGAVNIGGPYTGLHRDAAAYHDAAYATPGVKKADADRMLRDAMVELGCPQAQVDAFYGAVRLFGGPAYEAAQRSAA